MSAKTKTTTVIKTPTVLAFEGKIVPSDAVMFAGTKDSFWENQEGHDWRPIRLAEKTVRGTISNRLKAALTNDPAKLDSAIEKANIQTIDNAALPYDCDILNVAFTVRFLGGTGTPSTCNDTEYKEALQAKVNNYVDEVGFSELAFRYAYNIANGRFLWRNRMGAESVEVHVVAGTQNYTFDAQKFSLQDFDTNRKELKDLAAFISDGLSGNSHCLLEVNAYVKLGLGQTVYPSQEFVQDTGGNSKNKKSKTLYQSSGVAAFHSQKIGNALRSIDDWYADDATPIAVEPYGSVTSSGTAYRQPKEKIDFYSLLDGWLIKDKEPSLEQKHYIMAMFVRGGVFGEGGKGE